ncbi:ketopantoate reductase family protein [Clostridiaceae bacterium]|nr:ketopantoate reductase family protein [Clostridiaceae bacterium]RKI16556.1 ketopantoate reductase family protein [bacterium 1XD21-70]
MRQWTQAAIIGMGALGMMYGERIAEKLGAEAVCFVADEERSRRYQQMDFAVNGRNRHFTIRNAKEMKPVDLVIVAVKGTGLSAALDGMAPCVGPETTIISVLNGISSEEIIGERFGREKVICCIAQGMDAVKFGGTLHYSRFGELRIGILAGNESGGEQGRRNLERLQALKDFLDRAEIPYVAEKDIRYRLWGKFMLNVGVNQTCMAYETNYGGALAAGEAYDTMTGAMKEVICLANAEGVALTEKDMEEYLELLKTLSPEGMPSMRQDGLARRLSEVELFSGTVRRLAARHGLKVPVNDRLYERICEMEREYNA